ncbi:unnamed protein product [Acanthoscelides obtectus]|uniref:Uncharacterized protein n=1 Tax=Acanthoscelides obtectus TaxID=200917 RepID=A0A9P0KYM1_ACAOB|nr:unnamed protein product [Acanthoscelides obtectus]CAK1677953.1 hypothetical protein AOBTE_LOCUS31672 [Acanthoscelides obtectus]
MKKSPVAPATASAETTASAARIKNASVVTKSKQWTKHNICGLHPAHVPETFIGYVPVTFYLIALLYPNMLCVQ